MRRTTLLAGFSAATLLTGMTFAHAGNPTGPKGPGEKACTNAITGETDGFTVTWTPTSVFPPNHKMVAGSLTYAGGTAADELYLQITGILSDEVVDGEELNGTGNTLNDATWDTDAVTGNSSVSRGFQIRAERSGLGDGRTYTIAYTAKANPGSTAGGTLGASDDCSGTVTVDVPHDMGGGNDAKQQ